MSGLHPVFSTGRGGAGNMIDSGAVDVSAADEVIVSDSDYQKQLNKGYKADKDGKFIISSGRGGAGNMTKTKNVPIPKVSSNELKAQKSPIFSTGRGGAGNIIHSQKSNGSKKTKEDEELEDQISPIHSNGSGLRPSQSRSLTAAVGDEKPGVFKKIKKLFH
ncbi:unnamed protein product [Ambrosiozyma monospora]|uniref:Unnamed protein product n=1 Tax=Ambrosiozyma monospora TaxID=43982 RepID=A0A9W6Z972_AMBMO|nr:unnamed protein product [Ambrosiozyma monospora]